MKTLQGEVLAYRLGQHWAVQKRDSLLATAPSLLLSVPLHRRKRWQRGYDQTAELARGVSYVLGVPLASDVLIRTRATEAQSAQTAQGRWDNVRGVFRVRREAKILGLRILLIDDILTTGATCDAVSRCLLQAGAAQVDVAVLAHD